MSKNSTSSSSAPAPAATSPRSAPRSSASATACIDEWKNDKGGPAPGGTCTNVGCIPSKALLQSQRALRARRPPLRRPRHRHEGPGHRRGEDAGAQGHGRQAEQRRHPVPVQEEQGDVLPRPRVVRRGRRRRRLRGRRRRRAALVGKQVDRRHRLERARTARRAVRREDRPQQRRRAAHRATCRSGWC